MVGISAMVNLCIFIFTKISHQQWDGVLLMPINRDQGPWHATPWPYVDSDLLDLFLKTGKDDIYWFIDWMTDRSIILSMQQDASSVIKLLINTQSIVDSRSGLIGCNVCLLGYAWIYRCIVSTCICILAKLLHIQQMQIDNESIYPFLHPSSFSTAPLIVSLLSAISAAQRFNVYRLETNNGVIR